jgi:hypothetical protein
MLRYYGNVTSSLLCNSTYRVTIATAQPHCHATVPAALLWKCYQDLTCHSIHCHGTLQGFKYPMTVIFQCVDVFNIGRKTLNMLEIILRICCMKSLDYL